MSTWSSNSGRTAFSAPWFRWAGRSRPPPPCCRAFAGRPATRPWPTSTARSWLPSAAPTKPVFPYDSRGSSPGRNGAECRCRAMPSSAADTGSKHRSGGVPRPAIRCSGFATSHPAARSISRPNSTSRTRRGWTTTACSTASSHRVPCTVPWPLPSALRRVPGRRSSKTCRCAIRWFFRQLRRTRRRKNRRRADARCRSSWPRRRERRRNTSRSSARATARTTGRCTPRPRSPRPRPAKWRREPWFSTGFADACPPETWRPSIGPRPRPESSSGRRSSPSTRSGRDPGRPSAKSPCPKAWAPWTGPSTRFSSTAVSRCSPPRAATPDRMTTSPTCRSAGSGCG